MIPGKKYTPEDFLEIAWRRRWVIVLPFVCVALGTILWAQSLPNMYRSRAVVLVMPPQVPQTLVRPTIVEPLQKRLDTMRQEILSRPRLEALITEFDLYPELRRERLMEEVVARMRDDIDVSIPKTRRREEPNSFQVSYQSPNPRTAMTVADRLAILFVRTNSETRAVSAGSTSQFLEAQLADSRRKLQDVERRLEEFRRANAGRLPTDVDANLKLMTAAQDDLQALQASIAQDRDRQLVVRRMIADEMALATVASGKAATSPATAAGRLAAAEEALAKLRQRLKETHPDVRALKRQIEDLKAEAEQEALRQPVSGAPAVPVDQAEQARLRRISSLRAELESLDRRIESKQAQAGSLRGTIASYKAKIDAAPALQSELARLTRDYETLDAAYEALLLKSQDANVAANLEEQQVSEHFKIVESARVPERPSSPDRVRLSLMGALAGLGLGLAIAGLLEYKDQSLRTEDDIVLTLALPVLAMVPTMMTGAERAQKRRRRLVLATSGAAVMLAVLAVFAWKLQVLSAWMR